MASWTKEELRKLAETDDLHISPFREDGKTYGTPTWIWSLVVDDALTYARRYGLLLCFARYASSMRSLTAPSTGSNVTSYCEPITTDLYRKRPGR
jgi:hypothetical protein